MVDNGFSGQLYLFKLLVLLIGLMSVDDSTKLRMANAMFSSLFSS